MTATPAEIIERHLEWRSLVPTTSSSFLVKGTELSCAVVPGTGWRFMLYEVRCYGPDREPDRRYRLRDAASVCDADVREGKRPGVCWEGESIAGAVAHIEAALLADQDAQWRWHRSLAEQHGGRFLASQVATYG